MEKGTFAPTKTLLNTTEKRTFGNSGTSWMHNDKTKSQKPRQRCDGLIKRLEFFERKISEKQNEFWRIMQVQKDTLDKQQKNIEAKLKEQDSQWVNRLDEYYSIYEKDQN